MILAELEGVEESRGGPLAAKTNRATELANLSVNGSAMDRETFEHSTSVDHTKNNAL